MRYTILLPIRAAKPRTNVRVPNPDVSRSTPHILTMAGDVTATQAAREMPKIVQHRAKLQYSSEKEMPKGAMPPIAVEKKQNVTKLMR